MDNDKADELIAAVIGLDTTIQDLVNFWLHGPEFKEEEMGSAEEDKIDDDVGESDLYGQAKTQHIEDFRKAGYPGDFFKSD